MAFQAIDDFARLGAQKYIDIANDYNSKVEKIQAVNSIEEFTEHFLNTDPELEPINQEIERLETALRKVRASRESAAKDKIQPAYEAAVANTGVDLNALDEQLKTLKSSYKYLTGMYGEELFKDAPEIAKRKTTSTASSGGSSTGVRRIRGFDVYVNGVRATMKNAKGEVKSTFTAASKQMGVDNTALQTAFFTAAGGDDPTADNFPTLVEFEFEGNKVRVVKQGDSDDNDE